MPVIRDWQTIVAMDEDTLLKWKRDASNEFEANQEDIMLNSLIDSANIELDERAARAWGGQK